LTRRDFIKIGSAAAVGEAGLVAFAAGSAPDKLRTPEPQAEPQVGHAAGHDTNTAVGEVDHATNGFHPTEMLYAWDHGKVSMLPNGQTLREYRIVAVDKEIEVLPGVRFPAWTYNGRVPGPTLRCTEGDRVRIHFTNGGSHPHSIHFHGVHPAEMDSIEPVPIGQSFTYEFDAEPFGLHLYHCHTLPLKRHLHKGLYGGFIVDPKQGRSPAHEMFMLMNGFDTNFDGENEVYAVNTVGFHFLRHPVQITPNELVRVYLVNILEFDLINGFHLHANFFDVYRTGTRLQSNEYTDTIILGQAERAILEFRIKYPGKYLFHAHVSEFAELGWTGLFEVRP
jgi:FtsP/CotA-like multicopper oxidase with cupredoxin domain